ncbi:MAG: nucleotidyltransferase family protein [Bacteroidales bacterium]|jgi:hypothetical protein|nr:nucleotidyltransferase family protein [Bacteroidales bacterium]
MKKLLPALSLPPSPAADSRQLAEMLRQVTDWPALVTLINAHGVIALAAANITAASLTHMVPPEQMAMLRNGLLQSIVRNTWLAQQWEETNRILLAGGIKHILLKGMVLEHTVYGAAGLRQMSDCDMLVEHRDARRAWNLLCSHGFRPLEMKSPLHRRIMFSTRHHLPALVKNGYPVEIHTEHNLPLLTADPEHGLLHHCEQFTVNGVPALKLKDPLHIAFLQQHFNHHASNGECQLRTFTDLCLLDPGTPRIFPQAFMCNPIQTHLMAFRKAAWCHTLSSMPPLTKLLFIAGDIFPTMAWMKKRYRCSTPQAILKYPARAGKLLWLLQGTV